MQVNLSTTNVYTQKVNNKQSKTNFGRAVTTNEANVLCKALGLGNKRAGIDFLTAIMPVAATPANHINSGIGTFLGLAKFSTKVSKLTGINSNQLLPLGETVSEIHSPFETPAFGLYHGYIELSELTKKEYGHLLDKNDDLLNNFYIHNPYRNNYKNIGQIESLLDKAYDNYEAQKQFIDYKTATLNTPSVLPSFLRNPALRQTSLSGADNGNEAIEKLTREFNEFKEKDHIKYWLDTYAINKDPQNTERYKFKQFIAEKQYQEMQAILKEKNIKLIVDCPIGFNKQLDGQVAAKNCKGENPFFEGDDALACDNNGQAVRWGNLPVLHPDKQSAKSLEYHKALYHAKHGDGVRLDAAQYKMYPSINNGHDNGVFVPQVYYANPESIINAFVHGLKDGGATDYLCVAEHLHFKPQYDVSHVDRYLANNPLGNIPQFSCAQWRNEVPTNEAKVDCYANHDEKTIHYNANGNGQAVQDTFTWFLNGPAHKYQVMSTDLLGYSDLYNAKNTVNKDNWRFKFSENWEQEYHDHLQSGLGFNAPETLNRLLKMKNVNDDKTNKLQGILYEFGRILREKSDIKTEDAANAAKNNGKLQEYLPNLNEIV